MNDSTDFIGEVNARFIDEQAMQTARRITINLDKPYLLKSRFKV